MIVTCIARFETKHPELGWTLGDPELSSTNVSQGKDYVVYAMALLSLRLVLLIADDSGAPVWLPAEWFRVSNSHLPMDWSYDICRQDSRGLRAIWGYREIVERKEHNDALIDRRPDALRVFRDVAAQLPLQVAQSL